MPDDIHVRAWQLIERQPVEGITTKERQWLEAHLEACPACTRRARATEQAIRNLRSIAVPTPPGLAARTQMRVYLRAQETRPRQAGWVMWTSFALSWLLGVASAPFVWRGFEWAGRLTGLPTLWLKLTFGLWWGLPAAIAAGIWVMEKRSNEEVEK